MSAIALAVLPLKQNAADQAVELANKYIASVTAVLASNDNDLDAAYPYPNGRMGRAEYRAALNKRHAAQAITRSNWKSSCLRKGEPNTVAIDAERCAKFVESYVEASAASFDAYVSKLESKIVGATAAELIGDRLWNYSILAVTLADGTVQKWKTQMILNVSVLGTLFNQWPTRLVK